MTAERGYTHVGTKGEHVAAYHHIGITVVTRQVTKRENERENRKRRKKERAERGDTHWDQKRGKESTSQRTVTGISQWSE